MNETKCAINPFNTELRVMAQGIAEDFEEASTRLMYRLEYQMRDLYLRDLAREENRKQNKPNHRAFISKHCKGVGSK